MIDILDIRTLSLTTLFFSLIYGCGLIVYAANHRAFSGISTVGAGYILLAIGFLFIGLRNFINEFFSVIIANTLLLVAIVLIAEGLISFRQAKVKWTKHFHLLLFLFMLPGFIYFTYFVPDINARIIIFAGCYFLECSLCGYLLLYKTNSNIGMANSLLGIMFIFFAIFFLFRAVITAGEAELNNFMNAGLIHALSIVVIQTIVLFSSFSIIWIASNSLKNELIEKTRIDPLTATYNRRALEDIANLEMNRAIRSHRPLSIIMADIDHFKSFNDIHGHQLGDRVLKNVAAIFKDNVRENDFVARYGGEEFIILLPETTRQQASQIAEKLRALVQQQQLSGSRRKRLNVTASFGVSNFQEGMSDWKQIVKAADHALYDAKNKGRNRVVVEPIGDKWASIKIK